MKQKIIQQCGLVLVVIMSLATVAYATDQNHGAKPALTSQPAVTPPNTNQITEQHDSFIKKYSSVGVGT